eukprot:SAG11_NODE_2195_length_3699_cov_22.646919_1_plen_106_part_10
MFRRVELVQGTLHSMESKLEQRLSQLENRVGEVGQSYIESFDLPGTAEGASVAAATSGGGGGGSVGDGGGDSSDTKIKRMDDALRLYQGYLGKGAPRSHSRLCCVH